jgi:hypothetical protein
MDLDDELDAEIAALEAQGLDPYADRAAPTEVEAAVAAAEPEAPTATTAEKATPEPVAADATETEPAQEKSAQDAPAAFRAAMPEQYKAQRAGLMKAKADAMSKLMDGEIDAEAYAALEMGISDQLEDLTALRIRSETLIEANAQNEQFRQAKDIQALIARTKGEVDYASDPKAAKQFDAALQLIGADPDNTGMAFADLIQLSHKMVAAMRGVVPAKAALKPAPDRTPPTPPITLSGLPTAATSGAQSVSQAVSKLNGDALQDALDSMPEAEYNKLMRG